MHFRTNVPIPLTVPTPCSGKAASGNVLDYEEHGENKSRLWIFDPYWVMGTHGKGGRTYGRNAHPGLLVEVTVEVTRNRGLVLLLLPVPAS